MGHAERQQRPATRSKQCGKDQRHCRRQPKQPLLTRCFTMPAQGGPHRRKTKGHACADGIPAAVDEPVSQAPAKHRRVVQGVKNNHATQGGEHRDGDKRHAKPNGRTRLPCHTPERHEHQHEQTRAKPALPEGFHRDAWGVEHRRAGKHEQGETRHGEEPAIQAQPVDKILEPAHRQPSDSETADPGHLEPLIVHGVVAEQETDGTKRGETLAQEHVRRHCH